MNEVNMISIIFTVVLILYVVFFSYKFHFAKKKYKETGNPVDDKKMRVLLMLMPGLPLVLVFGILPKTDINNAVNVIVGIISMLLPFLLG